ncbi:hypothetical protein Tco_1487885 [Tanacetum coccineum]
MMKLFWALSGLLEMMVAKQTKPSAPKASKVTKPADDKAPKQTSSQPPKSTPAPTEPSKKDQGKKCKPVKETSDAPSPTKRSKAGKGPARLVVFREPDSKRFQPLPEVQGKGKEKVIKEQAAPDLLTLQTPKRKSPAEQFIFQRRTPMPPKPFGIADSPSLDADLAPTDSEMKSNEEVPGINAGDQDEGQAGPNPESQPQSSHVVHAGPNLEHMDLEAPDDSTQQNTKQMDEEFTTTAYPNELSFTNQFLEEKSQEDEPKKTNTESEVQSMVTVPIHQDTSFVSPMATSIIDLTISHPVSTTVHAPLPTSTTTTTSIITTTSLPPLPPQPQQISSDPILLQRIRELKQHIVDLIQRNLALEERLDKHRTRLYNLENLNIPQKVSKIVDEIVTDTVDWAMQAPLRAHFSDLPIVDMKEVL